MTDDETQSDKSQPVRQSEGEPSTFENVGEQIAHLERRIEETRIEIQTAPPERRSNLGWRNFGRDKQIGRLATAERAKSLGQHVYVICEVSGDKSWSLCSCGARIPGVMHEDFTMENFAMVDGHIREDIE